MPAVSPLLRSRLLSWLAPALLGSLVLAIYWPALHGALLWDDPGHVTRPDLQSWSGLWRIWSEVRATQQFYPVLHSAFWIEHRLWGDATLGYHLVNLLWHVTACCLFARLLRRLWSPVAGYAGRAVPAGAEWVAALLLAVHPLSVESVAWISEQKNTLSLVFYLLAGLAYLDFAVGRRARSYVWASCWFLLALGTKSVTATLPAAILVVLWWRHGRLEGRRDVLPLLPWLLVAATAGLFTAWVEITLIGAEGAAFELSFVQRVLLAARVVWFYAGKLAWPSGQAFFYEHWEVAAESLGWIGYLLAALTVTGGLWISRRHRRGLLAGWLLFVGSLFPALGFFNVYPFVFSYVADHFQYLASLSFIGTAVGVTAILLGSAPAWARALARLGVVGVLAVLALLAHRQSRLYVNDETLFRATLVRSPESWMAHSILGFSLSTSGRHAEAIESYRAALRLNPDHPNAHVGLALELAQQPGQEAEAIGHYERALQLKPGASDAHNNLGLLLSTLRGRLPEAIAHYEAALRSKPNFAEAHANLANALALTPGRAEEAGAHFDRALQLSPNSVEMRQSYASLRARLGDALAATPGRAEAALAHYREALRVRPDFAAAHAQLANVLTALPGRQPEAMAHYEAALRLEPDVAWVHLALANQLSDTPARTPEAVAHAEAALRLKPHYAEAHNCLAILAAQSGRLDAARRHWEAAVQINPRYETARDNLRRLEQVLRRRGE